MSTFLWIINMEYRTFFYCFNSSHHLICMNMYIFHVIRPFIQTVLRITSTHTNITISIILIFQIKINTNFYEFLLCTASSTIQRLSNWKM